jgi:hypothetical protein
MVCELCESGTGSGLVRFAKSKFRSKFLKQALKNCCRLDNSLLSRSNPVCCCFCSPSVRKKEVLEYSAPALGAMLKQEELAFVQGISTMELSPALL